MAAFFSPKMVWVRVRVSVCGGGCDGGGVVESYRCALHARYRGDVAVGDFPRLGRCLGQAFSD